MEYPGTDVRIHKKRERIFFKELKGGREGGRERGAMKRKRRRIFFLRFLFIARSPEDTEFITQGIE